MSQSLVKAQRIVDRLNVFTSVANRPFVHVPCPENVTASRAVPLRSSAFRNWFFGQYWSEYDAFPSTQAFHSVLHHLEGRAFPREPRHSPSHAFSRLNLASHAGWLRCLAWLLAACLVTSHRRAFIRQGGR